jgi:hypothetical protein
MAGPYGSHLCTALVSANCFERLLSQGLCYRLVALITTSNFLILDCVSYFLCSFSGWHIVGSIALKDGADALVFALYR